MIKVVALIDYVICLYFYSLWSTILIRVFFNIVGGKIHVKNNITIQLKDQVCTVKSMMFVLLINTEPLIMTVH